jgi:hypothetical protein
VQGAIGQGWEALDEGYSQSREAVAAAMAVLGGISVGGCMGKIPCIKIEILRDFYQTIALFFASIANGAMEQGKAIWGNVSGLISLDFGFVVNTEQIIAIMTVVLAILGIVLVFVGIYAVYKSNAINPDELSQGHEAEDWEQLKAEQKRTVQFIQYFITAMMSAYLPISRSSFQILACDPTIVKSLDKVLKSTMCPTNATGSGLSTEYKCNCGSYENYIFFQILSVLLICTVTLYFPFHIAKLIRSNVPQGSPEDPDMTYDEDGNLVPYTDEKYQYDLSHDQRQLNCPYIGLYKGFERKWSYYKVLVMCFKFLICVPVIFLSSKPLLQSLVTLVLMGLFTLLSIYTTPFLSPSADKMDICGRCTASLTVLLGLLALDDVLGKNYAEVLGIAINIFNALNAVFMVGATVFDLPQFRTKMKNWAGRFTFEDTCRDVTASYDKILPTWDVEKEIKHRIWHTFWEGTLLNVCGEEVAERMIELQQETRNFGAKRIKEHWEGYKNPRTAKDREWARQKLEGVDVFWDGIPMDGKLDSETCFAKMWLDPYPFHCVIVYDDCNDRTFVWNEDFDEFVKKNKSPEIQRKVKLRRKLRAMAGQMVHLEHTQMESHSVEDGQETYTDGEGNTQTKTRYTTVQVEMSYHNGTLSVGANNSKPMAPGFKPSIYYTDGHGVAIAPHTGEHKTIHNSTTISGGQMGVDNSFEENDRIRELFNGNVSQWQDNLAGVEAGMDAYRQGIIEEYEAGVKILNPGFWYYVFNNSHLSRVELGRYLKEQEENPALKNFPAEHKAGLDYLYMRLTFVRSHPAAGFWFVFWDDFWAQNGEMDKVKDHADLFDPKVPGSIAYKPCSRDKLMPQLEAVGLLSTKKSYFSQGLLAALYEQMDARIENAKVTATRV